MNPSDLSKYDSIRHLPPRNIRLRFLGIHLATAVVMLLAAGGLTLANVTGQGDFELYDSPITHFGWPINAETLHEDGHITISKHGFALNIVVGLLTLAVAGGVCELIMRGRDRPQGALRVHLSTAFFAMLLAGALLGVNMNANGWPISTYASGTNATTSIAVDFFICLEFVIFLAAILEALIRRREARKP